MMSNPVARDPRQQLERHLKSHRTFRNVDHQLKWLKILYKKLNPDLAANTNNSPLDQSIGSASGHHQVSFYLRQMKAALRTQHGDYRPKPGTTSVLLLFDDSPKVPPPVSFIFVKYPKSPQDGLPTIIDDTANHDVAIYSAAIYQMIWEAFEKEEVTTGKIQRVDVKEGAANNTQAATSNTNLKENEEKEEFFQTSIQNEVENERIEIYYNDDNVAEQDHDQAEKAVVQNNGQATEGITNKDQQLDLRTAHQQQNQQHQPNNSAQSGIHLSNQKTSHSTISVSLPAGVSIKQESYDGLNCEPSHSESRSGTLATTYQPSSSSSPTQQNSARLVQTATRISSELCQHQMRQSNGAIANFDFSSKQLPLLKDDPAAASAKEERKVVRILVKSPVAQRQVASLPCERPSGQKRHVSTFSQTKGASTSASTNALATSSRVLRQCTGSSSATGGEATEAAGRGSITRGAIIAESGRKRSLVNPADLAFDQSGQELPSSVKRFLSVPSSSTVKHSHLRRHGSRDDSSSSNQANGPSSLSTSRLTQTPNSLSTSTTSTQSNPVQSQHTATTVELVKGYLALPLYKRLTSSEKLPCPICQRLIYLPLMYDHLNTAHLGKKGRHICTFPGCDFTATIFLHMVSHLQYAHKLTGNDHEMDQFVDQYGEARAAASAVAASRTVCQKLPSASLP